MNPPSPDDDATVIRPIGGFPPADSPQPPAADDPRTVVLTGTPATGAGAAPAAAPSPANAERGHNALAIGSMMGEFEITRVLGEGGFGIVYLARDHALERLVALKEYMPAALALRGENSQVMVRSERHRDTFAAGLKSFINEARLLAQFDHRSLVKVYRFWEANGTAFMVMPFIEGQTLKDTLREMGSPPSEAWLMGMLAPLTEALQVLHAENCFHRDIAPDNIILISGSGLPLLLDFGAARRVIGDMTQALTVILKPGYAPIEQYAEVPSMKQGPWTDVYALAAVVYFAITGQTPPASVGRLVKDHYQPLAQTAAGQYSERLLQAVDRALQVLPDARTASIAEFRADLGLLPHANNADQATVIQQPATAPTRSAASTAAAAGAATSARAAPASRTGLWAGLGLGGVLVAGVAVWALSGRSSAPAPQTAYPATAGVQATPPSSSTPVATPSPAAVAAPAPVVVAAPAPAPTVAAGDMLAQFQQVVAGQTAGYGVTAQTERSQLRIDVDDLRFSITSAREGYVTVLLWGPDGVLTQLYPNAKAKNNHIAANQTLKLPQASWPLKASDPPGMEHFLVTVSAEPRSLAALSTGKEPTYGFLSLPSSAPASAGAGALPWLLGKADCGLAVCKNEYGAATFRVEAVK